MTRTYEQMYEAALAKRRTMINEGRDPKDGYFMVTQTEKLAILDKPPFMNYELTAARDRICGLQIALIDGASPQESDERIPQSAGPQARMTKPDKGPLT